MQKSEAEWEPAEGTRPITGTSRPVRSIGGGRRALVEARAELITTARGVARARELGAEVRDLVGPVEEHTAGRDDERRAVQHAQVLQGPAEDRALEGFVSG